MYANSIQLACWNFLSLEISLRNFRNFLIEISQWSRGCSVEQEQEQAHWEIIREHFGNFAVEFSEMENYGNSQWSQGLSGKGCRTPTGLL